MYERERERLWVCESHLIRVIRVIRVISALA